MDYAKVVPLVGYTAKVIGEVLDGTSKGEEDE
jgi:transcriptional regulator of heat shock response